MYIEALRLWPCSGGEAGSCTGMEVDGYGLKDLELVVSQRAGASLLPWREMGNGDRFVSGRYPWGDPYNPSCLGVAGHRARTGVGLVRLCFWSPREYSALGQEGRAEDGAQSEKSISTYWLKAAYSAP